MGAPDLLARLAALPGVRRLPTAPPLGEAVLLAGIELAVTFDHRERQLRKAWRERHRGGPTPLLLIVDEPSGRDSLFVLGPTDGSGALHSLKMAALERVLSRVAALPRLEAVRELAAELERLDEAGLPGVKLRQLLSLHTLDVRLRCDPLRWSTMRKAVDAVPVGSDWRGVLIGLGYDLERRRDRGFLLRAGQQRVAVVHPKADAADFARLASDGRPPEGVLLNDCVEEGASFGLLASGTRLRLFDASPTSGSAAARYIDLDASALQPDDRPLLALLGPSFLAEGGFAALDEEARAYGIALRRRLDETVRQRALPVLGRALGRWAHDEGLDPTDGDVRQDLEHAALTLVFRLLFLLYAESAGYLPIDSRAYEQVSLTALVREAAEGEAELDPRSAGLWGRFQVLIKAMRRGDTRIGVPAYNGALFARDGFDGARTLERVELTDPVFGAVLAGVGLDPDTGGGVDYSTLDIGHLGHIYEGLLSLRLTAAETPVRYEARRDRYVPADAGDPDVVVGELLWQTHEGGRKGGGVYYTRAELVRHLVRQAVTPSFAEHLERVRATAQTDPAKAAEELFDFAVLDPACGSAHFLVVVVNELADLVVRFLATTPLPALTRAIERLRAGATAGAVLDDVALLRRLVLKRCVFGVDVSPMGAEIAKLSLWLASFVPGLSLAYLDRNVVVGNSLIGVADLGALGVDGPNGQQSAFAQRLREALAEAAEAVAQVAASEDRTPEEVEASQAADALARERTAHLERLFDLWTAEPFGIKGARAEVELHGASILAGEATDDDEAERLRRVHSFLHWLPAFPGVLSRERPGFDAVVGNPPWEEVTVERLGFYARFTPGLRSLQETEREHAIASLVTEHPELADRLADEQRRVEAQRTYLRSGGVAPMSGDPDLYKYFCLRYQALLREGGRLGVVLPRSAFSTDGSAGFRRWLFEENDTERLDLLLNNRLWMFDTHPQYTVALVAARRSRPDAGHNVQVAGVARSPEQWAEQAASPGLALAREAFGPNWTTPLLRDQAEADVLARVRQGERFPCGAGGRWKCFAVAELHETNDRALWRSGRGGRSLWKGESFDQYDPHGQGERPIADSLELARKANKPRPGSGSLLAGEVSLARRRAVVAGALGGARVVFRDVSRSTDSRTVIACLVPPGTYLTNTAPYLAFVEGGLPERLACLAIMNSLPFDWQARRFVETHLNFFILEGLVAPDLSNEDVAALAEGAGRLSCIDERYAEVADMLGIEVGALDDQDRRTLRLDIDARVARAWRLTPADLDVMGRDFTLDAVPEDYRRDLVAQLEALR